MRPELQRVSRGGNGHGDDGRGRPFRRRPAERLGQRREAAGGRDPVRELDGEGGARRFRPRAPCRRVEHEAAQHAAQQRRLPVPACDEIVVRPGRHVRQHRRHRRRRRAGRTPSTAIAGRRARAVHGAPPGGDRAVGVVERGRRLFPAPALGVAARRRGHAPPPLAVRCQVRDRRGEAVGIAAPEHPAGHAGQHVLLRPPLVGHHHRQAARLRFKHDVAGGVRAAREHEHVGRRHRPRHAPAVQRPGEDRVGQPPCQLRPPGAVADDDPAVRDARLPQPRRRIGQQRQPLLLRDPPGIQERQRCADGIAADPPGPPQGLRPAGRRERFGVHAPRPPGDAPRLDPVVDQHGAGGRRRHEYPLATAVQPAQVEPQPALEAGRTAEHPDVAAEVGVEAADQGQVEGGGDVQGGQPHGARSGQMNELHAVGAHPCAQAPQARQINPHLAAKRQADARGPQGQIAGPLHRPVGMGVYARLDAGRRIAQQRRQGGGDAVDLGEVVVGEDGGPDRAPENRRRHV